MRATKLRNMTENIFGYTTGIYLHAYTHIHTLAGTGQLFPSFAYLIGKYFKLKIPNSVYSGWRVFLRATPVSLHFVWQKNSVHVLGPYIIISKLILMFVFLASGLNS